MRHFYLLLILLGILQSCSSGANEKPQLIGWGDSMMRGAGGEKSIIEVIAKELGIKNHNNFGVGGLKSNSIAVLQGGIPLKLILEDHTIRRNQVTRITYYNIAPFNFQTIPFREGSISGIPGRLERLFNKEDKQKTLGFSFTAKEVSEAVTLKDTVQFKFDNAKVEGKSITIIWAGRNDRKSGDFVFQTRDHIQAMVDNLNDQSKETFLILSICNGTAKNEFKGSTSHTNITKLNEVLASTFKQNFIDIREYMVKEAIYDMGITPTFQDMEDMKKDCIPGRFFKDHVHFNTLGYQAVGKYLAHIIRDKGWIN